MRPAPWTCSVVDAAAMHGISDRTAYTLIREGRFPVRTLKIGATVKVPRRDLEQFINGEAAS